MLNKSRLLTPGPTPLPEPVRLALAQDMIHHRKKEFQEIMASCQRGLRELFGVDGPVLPLACSGTGAMCAAVYALFNPGEKVIVVEAGKFGQRWVEIAKARGLEIIKLEVPWGSAASPEDVSALLATNPGVSGILLQLSETSTGVLQPVREIASACAKSGALVVVDGISAVGISPCPMDAWQLDCLLTGSQKGLMLPPGLALLALSPRAWEKAATVTSGCFYFDLIKERASLEKNQTRFTTPVNLLVGLQASLGFLLRSGLDAVYKKQWALTMMVRAGASSLGLEPLAPENFAWGVTSLKLPPDIDGQKILAICQNKFGVIMAGGQDALKGKIIRFGHMGWVDWGDCLAGLGALAAALAEFGAAPEKASFMAEALTAYGVALQSTPGQ